MILVTGASGLVGSYLVKALAQQSKKVKALFQSSPPLEGLGEAVSWIKGNVLDTMFLEEALQHVEQVYHCAATVSFNPKKKSLLYSVNVEGTVNVVNACLEKGIKKLVHVSSVAALGRSNSNGIISEQMNTIEEVGSSHYSKTKYLAEMEVWRGISEGLNAVIVNPSLILGAGDWNKGSTEIFQTVYKEFPWCTQGIGGFVDVKDVVNAMMLLMENDVQAERFIVNAENIAFKEIFTRIANSFGKKPPHKKVSSFLADVVWRLEAIKSTITRRDPLLTKETASAAQSKRYYDNSKLKQFFPQFEYTPMEETIQRICKELKKKYNL